jgi:DNA-binding CsgD family transcriptional regulator
MAGGQRLPAQHWDVRKTVLLYGFLGGALIALLDAIEFRYLVVEHSLEIYGGLVALIFVTLGIWLGRRIAEPRQRVIEHAPSAPVPLPAAAPTQLVRDEARIAAIGMTKRELEILELIAQGLSNREIAERAFVSENTVKTHSSRVFEKLGARRRTQAVQLGKELGLIR